MPISTMSIMKLVWFCTDTTGFVNIKTDIKYLGSTPLSLFKSSNAILYKKNHEKTFYPPLVL